ncbi:hypothetical protein GCM10020229_28600 [Kitasatospora albolonga]
MPCDRTRYGHCAEARAVHAETCRRASCGGRVRLLPVVCRGERIVDREHRLRRPGSDHGPPVRPPEPDASR